MNSFIFHQDAKATTVTITAKTADKTFKTSVRIDPAGATEGTLLHSLGARRMIRDLEEKRSYLHLDGKNKATPEDINEEIIRLSTSYSVLSPLTAFIGVEERNEGIANF